MYWMSRNKNMKPLLIAFLVLALAFSPLLSATVSYAEETAPEEQSEEPVEVEAQDPEAPQNLRVVEDSVTTTGATIKWDLNPDKNDIDIWVKSDTSESYFTWGNSGEKVLTELTPNTTYKFYITWYERPLPEVIHKSNIIEFTTKDGEVVVTPGPTAGATNLEVVSVTHNSVKLKWVNATGIDDYWIWDTNGNYKFYGNTQLATVGGLNPETTYSFLIGPDGIQWPQLTPELKSNVVTFTTTEDLTEYEPLPLMPPQNLKVISLTESSVTLGWEGSPTANGYEYWINGGYKGGIWDGSNRLTYNLTPEEISSGATLTFLVGAQLANDDGVKASEKSNAVTLTWGQLDAPRDLQVVSSNRTTAALGWAPTPGASSYDIYQDGVLIGSSNTNRYTVNGLTAGQSYTFTAKAKNSLWESSLSGSVSTVPGSSYNNVTYYTAWSGYARNFKPTDIDLSKVTHINYAFADLCWMKAGSNGVECQTDKVPLQDRYVHDGEMVVGDQSIDLTNFQTFSTLKDSNPHLKMLVSVGGWSFSDHFSDMAATEETRLSFSGSVVKFLRAYDLDGVDIDWEYPVEGGEDGNSHRPEDNVNFTALMKTVREALDAAGSEDGKYYLLTIASQQADSFIPNADLANSVQYLDFINIMAYDYSGNWELLAHHNSPLYYDETHPKASAERNNVRGGALGHLNGGVPPHKLLLGVPYYGKGWEGCPEPGEYQTCTGIPVGKWENGFYDFDDLENSFIGKNGYVRYWNESAKVPYLFNEDTGTFITYNDETSMMYAASLVKTLDLGGVMSWEISNDENRTLTTQLVKDLPITGIVNPNALAAPQQLVKVNSGTSSIELKWNEVEGAAAYEVYVNNRFLVTTDSTQGIVTELTPSTDYTFTVLAIAETDGQITEVSPFSAPLAVRTSGFSSSSGSSAPPVVATAKNELEAEISKSGDTWHLQIKKDAAVKAIGAADTSSFIISAAKEAKQAEITLPKEVVAAIAAKGEDAKLSVILNGVTYAIPVHAIHLDADIRIVITSPDAKTAEAIQKLAVADGVKLLVPALDFKILKKAANGQFEEVTAFGSHAFSRLFTLSGSLDPSKATGVVYLPDSNEFRPVPTLFTKNSDGTVTAELIRNGNSIYTVIQSDIAYSDVKAEWAKKAVNRAAAKLLLDGITAEAFGVDKSITRAEFTSMIVKGLGILPAYGAAPFEDVAADSPYAGDIAAAKQLGLVQGNSATQFDPDASISRQNIAVLLANLLAYLKVDAKADDSVLAGFTDAGSIAPYAKSATALVVKQGLMIGKSGKKFDPLSSLTRAEAAVIVIRVLETYKLDKV
ncbi:glycosyl hydrolase family 18 protein [Paenibacillus radicis (ex Gao et al. 2016)]|uniref:chitinase n=1 Tax=Paenibacillus radicis (ex Gao et al. 2016) TaxID=1737354 RepID=A0A917HHC6_9BACL|nr:glycosyl hydrolase family 18 protein [Paenibacillus radicis (ex Gao et al. 2016)]GGG78909.1 hypothetical protein GCM10010918_39880 [Paenibacillus radicis (ex Gao et al. 2016)]